MKMKPKPIAYPPGWFTELIRLHNWPPNFVCSLDREARKQAPPPQSHAMREQQSVTGVGWGSGTVLMQGTPRNLRPGWMR